jgi:hypothetical protein
VKVLNNVSVPNAYGPTVDIWDPIGVGLGLQIFNNSVSAIIYSAPTDGSRDKVQSDELSLSPGSMFLPNATGFKAKNLNSGQVAQIFAQLYDPTDPIIQGFTPNTATISITGQFASSALVQRVALANFPPANPVDTQIIALQVDTSHEWLLVYNASTSYWDFIGGPPLFAALDVGDETTTSVGYTDLTTVGPSVTCPRAGDYLVDFGTTSYDSSSGAGVSILAAPRRGSTAPSDTIAIDNENLGAALAPLTQAKRITFNGAATSDVVKLQYRTNGSSGFWRSRWISITPVRIQ